MDPSRRVSLAGVRVGDVCGHMQGAQLLESSIIATLDIITVCRDTRSVLRVY